MGLHGLKLLEFPKMTECVIIYHDVQARCSCGETAVVHQKFSLDDLTFTSACKHCDHKDSWLVNMISAFMTKELERVLGAA